MMKVYDGTSMVLIKSFQAHTNGITRIKQLPNGYAVTCSEDMTVKIWNLTTNTMKFNLIGHNLSVHGLKLVTNDILSKWVF